MATRAVSLVVSVLCMMMLSLVTLAGAASEQFEGKIFSPGELKPTDSELKVKVGDKAPDFTLPSISGEKVSLSQFQGKKNVVLSFVPAAWTPVCSEQWPGYNLIKDFFNKNDTVVLGISVDNVPTLYAWVEQMGGVWFPVLSDFWPHGAVAERYGVLRTSGTCERAVLLVDKQGTLRYIDVHDVNERPNLETLMDEVGKLNK